MIVAERQDAGGAPARSRKILSKAPTVHPTSRIHDSALGPWTDIGANCSIVESTIGDYTRDHVI